MSSDGAAPESGATDGPGADTPVETLHGAPVGWSRGQQTIHPARDSYLELVERLREDGYWVCTDLLGVDYLGYGASRDLPAGVEPERFEVVANLLDPTEHRRIRVRVQVPESDPRISSLLAVHPGVDHHERETWDMFGIAFDGHPNLSRILMPEDWEGHPLRKDYAVGRIPVQFKSATNTR